MMTSHRNIVVLDYQKEWKEEFKRLKEHYLKALGNLIISVEHVGSTSVKGLAAKPILDIDLVIKKGSFEKVRKGLESIGYTHVGDQGIKGREVFKLDPQLEAQWYNHHLYVCYEDSEELFRMILFRDYLRSHPQMAEKYGKIKKEASGKFPHDINGYMDYKGPLVVKLLKNALVWSEDLPVPKVLKCEQCGSDKVRYEFQFNYEGEGNKSEIFEMQCQVCSHEWKIPRFPDQKL